MDKICYPNFLDYSYCAEFRQKIRDPSNTRRKQKVAETTRNLRLPNAFCYNVRYGSTLNKLAGFDSEVKLATLSEPRTETGIEYFAYQDKGLSPIFNLIVFTRENTLNNINVVV